MRELRMIGIAAAAAVIAVSAACGGSGLKLKLDPESEEFYKTGRLIMTSQESKIFSHLPDAEARKEFIKDFWDKRDPDPETPDNEFKMDFESRVQYANKHFIEGGPGYNTERGRIYIFMGPPDSQQEYFTHSDAEVQGSIILWGYSRYELAIEFVDEKGDGRYTMRRYEGFFFKGLENLKLGQDTEFGDVFKKKIVDFGLTYDKAGASFKIALPADSLALNDDEGKLRSDLVFIIYIYPEKGGAKRKIEVPQTFLVSDNEFLAMKEIPFTIPCDLAPGNYFVDVIVKGKEGTRGKIRKIFEVKTA
jgi:GWxTD domain-containing protein